MVAWRRWITAGILAGALVGCGKSPEPAELAPPAKMWPLTTTDSATPVQPVTAETSPRLDRPAIRLVGHEAVDGAIQRLPRTSNKDVRWARIPPRQTWGSLTPATEGTRRDAPENDGTAEKTEDPTGLQNDKIRNADFGQSMEQSGFECELAACPSQEEQERLTIPREISQQAEQLLQDATNLADPGAIYAARNQFIRVMRLLASSLDSQLGRNYHTQCLAAGMRALEEADDFVMDSLEVEADSQLAGYIAGHQTPILKDADPVTITAPGALRDYYDYAFDHLAQAGGQSPMASQALYLIGKAEAFVGSLGGTPRHSGPKPLAYYNAALAIDAANFQAANELGVMLARTGHVDQAMQVLRESIEVAPAEVTAENLVALLRQTGNARGARSVQVHYRQLASTPGAIHAARFQTPAGIQWVEPKNFVTTASAFGSPDGPRSVEPATHQSAVTPRQTPPPVPHGRTTTAKTPGSRNWW